MPGVTFTQRMKRGLRTLRRADDAQKRRLLMVATSISVVLIVAAWIGYMNAEIRPLVNAAQENTAPQTQAPQTPQPTTTNGGIVETFKRGVKQIVRWVGAQVSYIAGDARNLFKGKNYEYQFNNGGQGN